MTDPILEHVFQLALDHQAAERRDEAETLYRAILDLQPHHALANHALGVLRLEDAPPAQALPWLGTALRQDPSQLLYWHTYIDALHRAGQTQAALEVLELGRRHGLAGQEAPTLETAAPTPGAPTSSRSPKPSQKKRRKPDSSRREPRHRTDQSSPAEQRRLNELYQARRLPDVIAAAADLIQRYPGDLFAWKTYANVMAELNPGEDALNALRQAIELDPRDALLHNWQGVVLKQLGRHEEAAAAYRRAIEVDPNYAKAYNNLGNLLRVHGRASEAEASFRQALALQPNLAAIHSNLGNVLGDLGRLDEAVSCYRQALALRPADRAAYSNLLFAFAYTGSADPMAVRHESEGWERAVLSEPERLRADERRFDIRPIGDRPLRVGLLSAEFGQHAVAHFLLSWMRARDPKRLSLRLYPTMTRPPSETAVFEALADSWTPVTGLSDAEAADRLRADALDILIDTSGHTSNNRLGIIAHRAAPVQCHYIGYFATTGLSRMDYFLADANLIPPELDGQFTEQVWRLPRPWLAYTPLAGAPEPSHRADDGTLWLGSFNNLNKVGDDSLHLWAQVLHALPQAQLLLKDVKGEEAAIQVRVRDTLAAAGIDIARVHFAGRVPDWRDHMARYDQIDIALDTVPLNSGTTAFEALWMGVPLVTLAGHWMGGRMGAAILAGIGRSEWVAADAQGYVDRVVALARDTETRRAVRSQQREQMRASPLCDGHDLARTLDAAFRQMLEQALARRGE